MQTMKTNHASDKREDIMELRAQKNRNLKQVDCDNRTRYLVSWISSVFHVTIRSVRSLKCHLAHKIY